MRPALLSIVSILTISSSLQAQTTLWSENFDSYADGTTSGGVGTTWTGVCSACLTGDFFEVRSGAFSGNDVNDFAVWETTNIDISAYTSAQFSMDAIEVGDHEGPGCACGINIDYFDISYSIDGGAFVVIENWNGDGDVGHTLTGDSNMGVADDADWGSTTVSQTGLSGSTLRLRVSMRNASGSETLNLDNVLVQGVGPLPVELVSFEGTAIDDGNALSWITLTERDNSHFILESSTDAANFSMVTEVQGQGTTTEETQYAYQDRLATGTTYYRLKQVDFDGKTTSFKTISVSQQSPLDAPYPNPFNETLTITLAESAVLGFRATDGTLVGSSIQLEAGTHNIGHYVQDFPIGLVFLTVTDGGTSKVFKLRKY